MENNKRIIDITVSELQHIIIELIENNVSGLYQLIESRLSKEQTYNPTRTTLKGIRGIAKALDCGESKAKHLLSEGLLEGGIKRIGRTVYIPNAEALQDIVASNIEKRKKSIVRSRMAATCNTKTR